MVKQNVDDAKVGTQYTCHETASRNEDSRAREMSQSVWSTSPENWKGQRNGVNTKKGIKPAPVNY